MNTPKTLADLAYMVAVELKSVREGTLTTGGDNDIADTGRLEADDYWNKGPLWILGSGGTAPEGEVRIVTDFANATGTFTLKTDLSAVATAGDWYAVGRRRYPYDLIVQQLNAAYRDLGKIPLIDDQTLTTLDNTTEYDIPEAAIKDLREVWIQTEDTYPEVKGWVKVPYGEWRQELAMLYLPQYSADLPIKLVYVDEAPNLYLETDTITPYVHPNRIIYKAAVNCLLWRADRLNSSAAVNAINQRVNYLLDLDQKAKFEHTIRIPASRPNRLTMPNFGPESTGDSDPPFGYVSLR